MITLEKLSIYEKYRGDIDGLLLVGSDYEKQVMEDGDWYTISELISSIRIVEKGLASEHFVASTSHRIVDECEDSLVASKLNEMAMALGNDQKDYLSIE